MNAPAPTELRLLIEEYDPQNSDWNFRKGVMLDILDRQAASVGADARIILSSGPPGEEIGFWPSVGAEVAGEAETKAIIARADKFLNGSGSKEYASDILRDMLKTLRALASRSRSEWVSKGEVPDWKQDQAETSRLKPRPQSEVRSEQAIHLLRWGTWDMTPAARLDWKKRAEDFLAGRSAAQPSNPPIADIQAAIDRTSEYGGAAQASKEPFNVGAYIDDNTEDQ